MRGSMSHLLNLVVEFREVGYHKRDEVKEG